MRSAVLVAVVWIALPWAAAAKSPPPAHGKEFWRGIVQSDFAVPERASPYDLIVELTTGALGSTDPELRDNFGYEIPVAWIYVKKLLSPTELEALRKKWQANLAVGLGVTGNESVLLRSFSALDLSILAAYDNEQPWLEAPALEELLGAALDYLAKEQDVRGFVPGSGWHHSTAHTADLLKFLARSRHLKPGDQGRILSAIAAKLSSAGSVYVWGEDGRLASTILSLLRRGDFAAPAFDAWVDARATEWEAVWKAQPIDPAKYAAAQNGKNVLQSLFVILSAVDAFPARDAAREKVLTALRKMA